ncbi:MAG: M48 family metallopeptidase [Ardenticatenales bacterium]|nr:M48 family metallopeptidase [Ardenticatenales bacterium]
MTETVVLDQVRQEEARRYSTASRRWMVVESLTTLFLLLLFLFSGTSARLAGWSERTSSGTPWLTVALYGAMLFLGYTLLSVAFGYLGSFRLAHHYGMSNQNLASWATDQTKGALLTALVAGVMGEIIYVLLRWQPDWWWLLAALFLLFFTVLMGQLAPILILPLFYKLSPLEDEALRLRLERLGEKAGTHVEGIYTIHLSAKSQAANALVMGLGKTRRIALGDTLYRDFSHDEIEAIFAHELGHHVHGDVPKLIAVQSLLTLGGLWLADGFLRWGVARLGFASIADIGAFPLFLLAMALFFLLTMPLSNGFSRWRERLADRYALESMEEGESLVRVMTRLANQNLAEVDPPRWVVWFLHSHPPLKERIEAAYRFGASRVPAPIESW